MAEDSFGPARRMRAAGVESRGPGKISQAYPAFRRKTPYDVVRMTLLRGGWQPVISPDADVCPEGDTRCQGRPEMQACAGTGEGNCLFLWCRTGTLIAVSTIDDPPVVMAVECRANCRQRKPMWDRP